MAQNHRGKQPLPSYKVIALLDLSPGPSARSLSRALGDELACIHNRILQLICPFGWKISETLTHPLERSANFLPRSHEEPQTSLSNRVFGHLLAPLDAIWAPRSAYLLSTGGSNPRKITYSFTRSGCSTPVYREIFSRSSTTTANSSFPLTFRPFLAVGHPLDTLSADVLRCRRPPW